jgi:hypothetical protein
MMRFYNQQHRFYCGIDLDARTLAVCILDAAGAIAFRGNVAASPKAVLDALAPFREGVAVACECMFAWYWLADLCEGHGIPFAPRPRPVHEDDPRRADTDSDLQRRRHDPVDAPLEPRRRCLAGAALLEGFSHDAVRQIEALTGLELSPDGGMRPLDIRA